MASLKILLITSTLNQGGIERQIYLLAPALKSRGHDVTVAVFYPGDYYEKLLMRHGITIVPLSKSSYQENQRVLPRVARWATMYWRVARTAAHKNYDVIYGFGYSANFLALATKPSSAAKVIWGIRNSVPYRSRLHRALERTSSRFVDMIISNSQRGAEYFIQQGLCAEKFKVIPNGINTIVNRPNADWRRDVRHSFGIKECDILIGAVGRIDENKDRKSLLEAATKVLYRVPHAKFLIIGRSRAEYLESLCSLANELGIAESIIWSPPRDDIERCLNALDIFVSSSITEGFPNVVAEAMAVGVPCVVTDAGDSANIVLDLGYTVPVSNPDAMADKILGTIANFSRVDHQEIRKRIVTEYSVERMVSRTEAAMFSLVS